MNESTTQAEDAEFEALFGAQLRAHYRNELDPHLNGATSKIDLLPIASIRPSRLKIGARWSAAAMLLVGIGVAIAVVDSRVRAPRHSEPMAITTSKAPTDAIVTSWAETYDGGTVLVDPETPARMLRRVQYEKTEWKDAAGKWQSTTTTPQQDVILVDLQKQ